MIELGLANDSTKKWVGILHVIWVLVCTSAVAMLTLAMIVAGCYNNLTCLLWIAVEASQGVILLGSWPSRRQDGQVWRKQMHFLRKKILSHTT